MEYPGSGRNEGVEEAEEKLSPRRGEPLSNPGRREVREMDKKAMARAQKQIREWLKKWDGKCSICNKAVGKSHRFKNGMPDMINGAVIGEYIEVYGHRTCVQNVDRLVVGVRGEGYEK
jgi:hypothetical protein